MAKKPTNDNKTSVVNFGVGWVVIIYCLLMFFLYVGMCNDGANITAPNVANRLGVENGTIMNMNSLAGLVGVVFFIIVGQINRKIGARLTSGICCIILRISLPPMPDSISSPLLTLRAATSSTSAAPRRTSPLRSFIKAVLTNILLIHPSREPVPLNVEIFEKTVIKPSCSKS